MGRDEHVGSKLQRVFEKFGFGRLLDIGWEEYPPTSKREADDESAVVGIHRAIDGGPQDAHRNARRDLPVVASLHNLRWKIECIKEA